MHSGLNGFAASSAARTGREAQHEGNHQSPGTFEPCSVRAYMLRLPVNACDSAAYGAERVASVTCRDS